MSDQPKRPVETPREWLRYPGDIAFEDIGQAEAEEALQAAGAIQVRVMELMKGTEDSKPETQE